ncbi:Phage tail fibre protein [uncultured Caudovirales phage]|uniref:Phage tail fibre protein n=1 Tax=uncultured Caudovirales phage TaxID=2100421 RepID=A0A6J7WV07_9CAUD|nr:Phage tail fibre protein [uncultured Caudovirales phage]
MDINSIAEGLKVTGRVHLVKTNEIGQVVEERDVPNLVVTTGKYHIASKIVATTNSPASMTHMGIGTGTGAAAVGDTVLTQTGRVALSSSSVLNNTITYTATFPAGTGDGAITEAGIFNASSSGTMLCRTVFPTVNKGSGDQITITWVITVS